MMHVAIVSQNHFRACVYGVSHNCCARTIGRCRVEIVEKCRKWLALLDDLGCFWPCTKVVKNCRDLSRHFSMFFDVAPFRWPICNLLILVSCLFSETLKASFSYPINLDLVPRGNSAVTAETAPKEPSKFFDISKPMVCQKGKTW